MIPEGLPDQRALAYVGGRTVRPPLRRLDH